MMICAAKLKYCVKVPKWYKQGSSIWAEMTAKSIVLKQDA